MDVDRANRPWGTVGVDVVVAVYVEAGAEHRRRAGHQRRWSKRNMGRAIEAAAQALNVCPARGRAMAGYDRICNRRVTRYVGERRRSASGAAHPAETYLD